jgi:transposase
MGVGRHFILPPPKPKRGRRALSDDRSLINGILYVVTTGCRWREMTRKYGSYVTAGDCLEDFRSWGKIIEFLNS